MPDISYVQAAQHNIPDLMAGLRAYLLEFWGAPPPELLQQLDEQHGAYFPEALRTKDCEFWLAYDGEQFAGIGGLIIGKRPGSIKNPSGLHGYIFGMYTMPEYRRLGICRNILERLETSAKELGIGMLELHASDAGEHVYIKQGYDVHNEPTYRKYGVSG